MTIAIDRCMLQDICDFHEAWHSDRNCAVVTAGKCNLTCAVGVRHLPAPHMKTVLQAGHVSIAASPATFCQAELWC